MIWVPAGAWIGAVVLAIVLLGFCGYELAWKSRRLRRDLARLLALTERAAGLQAEIERARSRVLAARAEMTG